jgi:hypothetical protein
MLRSTAHYDESLQSSTRNLSSAFEAEADTDRNQQFLQYLQAGLGPTSAAAEQFFSPASYTASQYGSQAGTTAVATASRGTSGPGLSFTLPGETDLDDMALSSMFSPNSKQFTGSSDQDVYDYTDAWRRDAVYKAAMITSSGKEPVDAATLDSIVGLSIPKASPAHDAFSAIRTATNHHVMEAQQGRFLHYHPSPHILDFIRWRFCS